MSPEQQLIEIKNQLSKRFGSNLLVSNSFSERLYRFPKIKAPRETPKLGRILRKFSDLCISANHASKKNKELGNILLADLAGSGFHKLEEKLPSQQQNQWRRIKHEIEERCFEERIEDGSILFPSFCEYLRKESDSLCNNYARFRPDMASKANLKPKLRERETNSNTEKVENQNVRCILHNSNFHSTQNCKRFHSLTPIEKWFLRRKNNLCQTCLEDHGAKPCPSNSTV